MDVDVVNRLRTCMKHRSGVGWGGGLLGGWGGWGAGGGIRNPCYGGIQDSVFQTAPLTVFAVVDHESVSVCEPQLLCHLFVTGGEQGCEGGEREGGGDIPRAPPRKETRVEGRRAKGNSRQCLRMRPRRGLTHRH